MKNSIKNIAALVIVSFIAFSFATKESDRKYIKVSESKVAWKGYKVTGAHEGVLSIKSGQLSFDKEIFT